jgi:pimeloyl-ACP methyl ester carboxylesterase
LQEIRVPTLGVCGRQDPVVPVDFAAAIQEGMPGAELLVPEHTAHGWGTASEYDMAIFRRTTTQFLARLAG